MRRKALCGKELGEDADFMHFMAYLHLHNDCRKLSAVASNAKHCSVTVYAVASLRLWAGQGRGSAPGGLSIDVTASLYFRQITPLFSAPCRFPITGRSVVRSAASCVSCTTQGTC